MFTVSCNTCGTTRLFGARRIVGIDNTDHGIVVRVRCFCGAEATTVTGRCAAGDGDSVGAHHAHAA